MEKKELDLNELPFEEEPLIEVEIKPCYNYQSITIKKKVSENHPEPLFDLYRSILEGLKKVTDEVLGDEDVNFEPATDRQKEIMDHFKIVYPKKCSKEQAQKLIEKSIAKNNK